MRRLFVIFVLSMVMTTLTSCHLFNRQQINKIGMLIEGPLEKNSWEERGYEGLLNIKDRFEVDVFLKENIHSENAIRQAVNHFVDDGVTLIFGHGNFYGKYFDKLAEDYPEIQFIYFNGGYHGKNLTSLNFSSHALGFFSGMIAGKVSKTNQIGIIAAHEWQPEIEGFYEGVKFENSDSKVHINFVNDWNRNSRVAEIYEQMIKTKVDVVYPTGELFAEEVLRRSVDDNIFAIGYGVDQSYIDEEMVLTSTIQHVENLYVNTVEKAFNDGLSGGVYYYDFQDGAVSLGPFSPQIPEDYQQLISEYIETYQQTGLLPNEL